MEEYTVYESPDGGKTVYSRTSGSNQRQLVSSSPLDRSTERWLEFKKIIIAATTNPTLDSLLSQAEIVYQLVKDE
jgi:hypothetical protein